MVEESPDFRKCLKDGRLVKVEIDLRTVAKEMDLAHHDLVVLRHPPNGRGLAAAALPAAGSGYALGVGMWLSALNVQYRDVRYVIPLLT